MRTAHAQTELIEYYATDSVGSIRVVFDPSGTVKARSDYLPFGEEWQALGNLPTQRFTGQQRDTEEGLDYFGARSYQPRTGRFTTVDPVFAGLFQPQAWNRYSYALNSPLVYTDPTGLQAEACTHSTHWDPDRNNGKGGWVNDNNKSCNQVGAAIEWMWLWMSIQSMFSTTAYAPERQAWEIPRAGAPDPSVPYTGAPDGGATPTGDAIVEVLQTAAVVGNLKNVAVSTVATSAAKAAVRNGGQTLFAKDKATKATTNWSAQMKSEGDARALAKRMLGSNPVQVEPGKLRSQDGVWQYRAKPGDVFNNHVHLERLDPRTGMVIENVHLRWPAGAGR